MGLRWEYRTPVSDRNGALMSFDLTKRAYVLGTSLARFEQLNNTLPSLVSQLQAYGGNVETNDQAGLPANMVNHDYTNIGPRFGFAYRALDGKKSFVIRGGYRMSYYTMPLEASFNSQSSGALVQAELPQQRFEHLALAGRLAQLRLTQRAAVCRRAQHAQFHHRPE